MLASVTNRTYPIGVCNYNCNCYQPSNTSFCRYCLGARRKQVTWRHHAVRRDWHTTGLHLPTIQRFGCAFAQTASAGTRKPPSLPYPRPDPLIPHPTVARELLSEDEGLAARRRYLQDLRERLKGAAERLAAGVAF